MEKNQAEHVVQTAKDVQKFKERYDIDHALRAAIPILYIETFEEFKLLREIKKLFVDRKVNYYSWTLTKGLCELIEKDGRFAGEKPLGDTKEFKVCLEKIDEMSKNADKEIRFFFLLDPPVGVGVSGDFSWTVRKFRDLAQQLRRTYSRIILVCPNIIMPEQLTRDVQKIDLPLPNQDELIEVLERTLSKQKKSDASFSDYGMDEKVKIVRAALGLTESQAEDTFAKSVSALRRIDAKYVVAEKEKLIKISSNEILEFYHPSESLSQVCGIELLQKWLRDLELSTMTEQSRQHGVQFPKGMLLIGIPGCGKSMTVKAIGNSWNLPLLRMDIQRAFSKYIGETESNIDSALRFVEVVAPCVLWIDEVEKGFAGFAGDNTGTTARIFGKFLTWMQEREAPVFVCCTANRLESLPVEFSRTGRFSRIWFLGWPDTEARRRLFKVHLNLAFAKHPARERIDGLLADPEFDEKVIGQTARWTGAEVESICQDLLQKCELASLTAEKNKEDAKKAEVDSLSLDNVVSAIKAHRPMYITHGKNIEQIMLWVKERDVACAGKFEGIDPGNFINWLDDRKDFS